MTSEIAARKLQALYRAACTMRQYMAQFGHAVAGNVAMTFALAAIPIIGAVGGAVDYSSMSALRSAMQGAADSTSLSLIRNASSTPSDQLATNASAIYNGVLTRPGVSFNVAAQYDSKAGIVTVSASTAMPTKFMAVVGLSALTVSVSSKAKMGGATSWPVCVLVTDPDSNHTLLVKNQSTIDFSNCMVQVNTLNWDAVEARDTSYIHSVNGVNCFTGDIHYGDVTPPKQPTCEMLNDPYSALTVPQNTCTYTNLTVTTDATLQPGTYCGGVKISGGTATFSPGIYYIQEGDMQILGSANATGNGVTFVLSGKNTNVNINTTGTINLSRSTGSSQWAGFLFFWDQPTSKQGQKNVFSSAKMNLSGVLYFKGQTLSITNGAQVTVDPGSIIADFILPDSGSHLTLRGTMNSPTTAEQAMKKALPNANPVLVQ